MAYKFDICLMNPPYHRNLHLKFLEKAIQLSETTISIQPVRWLQDVIGYKKKNSDYNKYENSISKHIKSIDIISDKDSQDMFAAGFNFDLGIYVCDKNGGYDYKKITNNSILDKVYEKSTIYLSDKIQFSEPKNAVVCSMITGGNERKGLIFDLFWGDNFKSVIYDKDGKRLDNGLTFYENRKKTAWGNVKVRAEQNNIKFNNIKECENFIKYTKSNLFRYIFNTITVDVHVHPEFLPILGDYSKEYTDKELYEIFNINKDEQKIIENKVHEIVNNINNYLKDKGKEPNYK